jgi:hypothetical protein
MQNSKKYQGQYKDDSNDKKKIPQGIFEIMQDLAKTYNLKLTELIDSFERLYNILSKNIHDVPLSHDDEKFIITYGNG